MTGTRMHEQLIEKENKDLFPKTIPNLLPIALPLKWLWFYFTRRFGFLAKSWNASEPVAKLLVDGIIYGEGPRFRLKENALYWSDMYAHKVLKYDVGTAQSSVVYEGDDHYSGLGWLPDDRLLIVSMGKRQVIAFDQASKKAELYADVADVTRYRANDFVVDVSGRAYLGNFGFDYTDSLGARTTTLVRIDTDRSVHIEATKMLFPNGSVITPDGKTLIVAETFRAHLTAFDIQPDGSLANRRVWAYVGLPCDGICLDAEGCVWVSCPQVGIYKTGGALVRVREGGEIVNLYGFGQNGISGCVFACQLGTDRNGVHHLFFLEANTSEERTLMKMDTDRARQNGVLKSIEVPVGPARHATNTNYCGGYC